jgi:competence CoiA-like predicted nuclease
MNLFIPRTTQLYFGYQVQKPKEAPLQRLATKQELTFASFSQPIGWTVVSSFYLATHSKALALMPYLSFFKVISSQKVIYKTSWLLRKKAFLYKAYSRPAPLEKTTVKL